MKLISFVRDGAASFGSVQDDVVHDFGASLGRGATLRGFLSFGLPVWSAMAAKVSARDRIPLAAVQLLAPVPDASKYLGLGGNYRSHMVEAERLGLKSPPGQVWFNKQVSCINGPFAEIEKPTISDAFDYEGELGVVIGTRCRHVRGDDAWSVIAGYTVCNDLSVRDWQTRSPTHTLGKSFDTHGPIGPSIVTVDEIPDPYALDLRTFVNGELRQQASTAEMIVRIPAMIEELTSAFTLMPGDVLATGTPAGVGGLQQPPAFLKVGDVVRVEITGLGHIENRVVAEASR